MSPLSRRGFSSVPWKSLARRKRRHCACGEKHAEGRRETSGWHLMWETSSRIMPACYTLHIDCPMKRIDLLLSGTVEKERRVLSED